MSQVNFTAYEELVALVDSNQGVVTCAMGSLRDAHGAGKLGVTVVANISDELAKRGLSHFPVGLPVKQWETARIYRAGSAVGKIINAVLTMDDGSDDLLRRISGGSDAEKIKKIRELVCD